MSRCVVVAFAPAVWAAAWAARPELEPYVELLKRLAQGAPDWPEVSRYRTLLDADVDFVVPAGRLPAGLDDSDVDDSYIGRCVFGAVPTRTGNLHDLMNALTWAAFPRAKLSLCRRQVAVARARGRHTNRLRTRAQDRLAMIDEGGMLALPDDHSRVFGHGLLEDLVLGRRSRGFSLVVESDADDVVGAAITALALPPDDVSPDAR